MVMNSKRVSWDKISRGIITHDIEITSSPGAQMEVLSSSNENKDKIPKEHFGSNSFIKWESDKAVFLN